MKPKLHVDNQLAVMQGWQIKVNGIGKMKINFSDNGFIGKLKKKALNLYLSKI
jgi:hypothetical protein